jgi:hypothetical protein
VEDNGYIYIYMLEINLMWWNEWLHCLHEILDYSSVFRSMGFDFLKSIFLSLSQWVITLIVKCCSICFKYFLSLYKIVRLFQQIFLKYQLFIIFTNIKLNIMIKVILWHLWNHRQNHSLNERGNKEEKSRV